MAEQEKTYQELSTELDAVLAELQSDDVDVDTALELYRKGQELIKQLETRLTETENRITELKPKRAD